MMISKISTFLTKVASTKKKMTFNDLPSGKRRFVSFPITDFQKTKRHLLTWASTDWTNGGAGVDIFCFLDNNSYPSKLGPGFECLMAVGALDGIQESAGEAFPRLKVWAQAHQEWVFGHFSYDLSAETEPGSPGLAPKPDPVGFPDLFFFVPEVLIELGPAALRIGSFRDDQ